MKKNSILLSAALLLLTAFGSAVAGNAAEEVVVSDAYARAVPPGQPNSASFMTLTSKSDKDHALVEASSPAAEVVELHTHTMKDGMMQMRRGRKNRYSGRGGDQTAARRSTRDDDRAQAGTETRTGGYVDTGI